MKALDLQPTYENIKETFLNDSIDRNNEVMYFCELLHEIEGSCSIAVDGKWGCGKTFFVKQVKFVLDTYNEFRGVPIDGGDAQKVKAKVKAYYNGNDDANYENKKQVCVYYDAWENDNDQDPMLSLIYAILQSDDINISKIKNDRNFLGIVGSIADVITGRNVLKLFEEVKGINPLDTIKTKKSAHTLVNELFDQLLIEHGNRLVVFVDELDRCKPSYAVQVLERIKHYFSDERVTFVFAVNMEQLQHTIKKFYGYGYEATRYLDRFFDLRVSLSPVSREKYAKLVFHNKRSFIYNDMCLAVIDNYRFELREIAKYFRLTRIAYTPGSGKSLTSGRSERNAEDFSNAYILPILIGLKMVDESKYAAFIAGKNSEPLLEFLDFLNSEWLLNGNESYNEKECKKLAIAGEKEEECKRLVTIDAKVEQVYKALFGRMDRNDRDLHVGQLTFTANIRKHLMKTVSLLSNQADYR